MKRLQACIRYDVLQRHICGDLKVFGLLLGLQLGYGNYMCFLCLWNSWADKQHYSAVEWPVRAEFNPENFNVQHMSLVKPTKVYLLPLHIKLGLVKNFVKVMNQHGKAFKHICEHFPYKSETKLKQKIFVEPEIRKQLKDQLFKIKLTPNELVVQNVLGNTQING